MTAIFITNVNGEIEIKDEPLEAEQIDEEGGTHMNGNIEIKKDIGVNNKIGETHHRLDTGEKPFKCTHCYKAFLRRDLLNRHLRLHTGEKPYKCTHCEKSFSQKRYLDFQMMTHTGEKPYQCIHCEKLFFTEV